MAVLRIEAGPLSWEKQASNVKADRIVTACVLAWGYAGDPGDKAAVLDFFGTKLVERLQEIAAAQDDRKATAQALGGTAADRPTWSA